MKPLTYLQGTAAGRQHRSGGARRASPGYHARLPRLRAGRQRKLPTGTCAQPMVLAPSVADTPQPRPATKFHSERKLSSLVHVVNKLQPSLACRTAGKVGDRLSVAAKHGCLCCALAGLGLFPARLCPSTGRARHRQAAMAHCTPVHCRPPGMHLQCCVSVAD